MKKVLSLVLLIVMVAVLAVPAFADTDPCDPYVRVLDKPTNATITYVPHELSEQVMKKAVAASEGILPAGASFNYLTLVCQKEISCDEEEYDLALRVWGSRNRLALLFFKGVDDDAWTLVGTNKVVEVIDVVLSGSGTYAVAIAS